MTPKLPQVTSQKVIKIFAKLGFIERRQSGSHKVFRHPENKRIVIVPVHGGSILKKGTLNNIIKQSGLTRDEFIERL